MKRFVFCVVYLAVIGCVSFVVGRILPKFLFVESVFPYKLFAFEKNGDIYDRIKIKVWQNRLPDMSRVFPSLMPVKKIADTSPSVLYRMVQETCVAEFIHALLAIMGFACVFIWKGVGGAVVSVLFFLSNLPFIIVQRYNRPRLLRLYRNSLRKNARRNSSGGVLLLSCNTGEGHNSCAEAINEEYKSRGVFCTRLDALEFISKDFSVFVSRCHTLLYRRFPALFGAVYSLLEKHPSIMRVGGFVDKCLIRGSENLSLYIKEGAFDTVICTHIFAAKMLSNSVITHGINCKTAFVSTDYAFCPGADSICADVFFTPVDSVSLQFAAAGIPAEKIISSGIPVRRSFYTDSAPKGSLEKNKLNALLLNGSMGCGDIEKLVSKLSEIDSSRFSLTVVCGTNNKLKKTLDKRFTLQDNISVLGYEKNISALMDSADILITKPGGISTTEACVKKLPMLFINAVKGCESYNLDYFVSQGAAIDADDVNEAVRLMEMLCAWPKTLSEMSDNMPFSDVSPSAVICETMISKKDKSYECSQQAIAAF